MALHGVRIVQNCHNKTGHRGWTTSMSDMKIEGGCLCGAVRYTLASKPQMTAICHCTHCQRQGGSLFSMICMVPRADMTITGEMSLYLDTADSGRKVERHFCGKCGSPIISVLEPMPQAAFVKAGTLDNWQDYKPSAEFYRSRSAEWFPHFEGVQVHDGAPG
jgi:hypothetical protein